VPYPTSDPLGGRSFLGLGRGVLGDLREHPNMELTETTQQVAETKYMADVTPLCGEGKSVAGKAQSTIISDGGVQLRVSLQKCVLSHNI